jgi:hypothetical protein
MITGQCTVGHFLITTQKKLARKCVDQVIEFCVKYALKLTCVLLLLNNFPGVIPRTPGARERPLPHPSPARPKAVRSGALSPQLRGYRWDSSLLFASPSNSVALRTATVFELYETRG